MARATAELCGFRAVRKIERPQIAAAHGNLSRIQTTRLHGVRNKRLHLDFRVAKVRVWISQIASPD